MIITIRIVAITVIRMVNIVMMMMMIFINRVDSAIRGNQPTGVENRREPNKAINNLIITQTVTVTKTSQTTPHPLPTNIHLKITYHLKDQPIRAVF